MAKKLYCSPDGTAHNSKKIYGSPDGTAHRIKKVYIGDANSLSRLAWASENNVLLLLRYFNAEYHTYDEGFSLQSNSGIPSGRKPRYPTVATDGRVFIGASLSGVGYVYELTESGGFTLLGQLPYYVSGFTSVIYYNGYWYVSYSDGTYEHIKYGTTIEGCTNGLALNGSYSCVFKPMNGNLVLDFDGSQSMQYLTAYNSIASISAPYVPIDLVWTGSRYVASGTAGTLLTATALAGPYTSQPNGAVMPGNRCAYGNGKVVFVSNNTRVLLDGSNSLIDAPAHSETFSDVIFHTALGKFLAVTATGALYILNESNYTWSLYKSAPSATSTTVTLALRNFG